MKQYTLEVLRYMINDDEYKAKGAVYEHLGYMNIRFDTEIEAGIYYKVCNPHMRGIIHHPNYCSDWDPRTGLAYVPQRYVGQELNIEPFEGTTMELRRDIDNITMAELNDDILSYKIDELTRRHIFTKNINYEHEELPFLRG